MRDHRLHFRSVLKDALIDAGESEGRFRRLYDLDELFADVIADDDSPQELAAKAIEHLCIDDGEFNGNLIGVLATFRFLRETAAVSPVSSKDKEACYSDLRARIETGSTKQLILEWAEEWFR